MARKSVTIDLSGDDKVALERIVVDRNTPAKVFWRAKIVLPSQHDGIITSQKTDL